MGAGVPEPGSEEDEHRRISARRVTRPGAHGGFSMGAGGVPRGRGMLWGAEFGERVGLLEQLQSPIREGHMEPFPNPPA